MPSTGLGFPYPTSSDDPDVPADIQALADALNTFLTLPATPTPAYGASGNTITSTVFAALPTTPLSVPITNPSSVYNLEVEIAFGAWVANSNTGNQLQAGVAASGGMSFAADALGGGGIGAQGQLILTQNVDAHSAYSSFNVVIPAAAAAVTFTSQAKRTSASGTQIYNFPFLTVTPRRFIKP